MNLDALFNMHKVKFSKMEVLFKDVDVQSVIKKVNIFINIEAIFDHFHNPYMEEQITVLDDEGIKDLYANIISNTINLAAHYRLFFTKNKIASNIVFYVNEPNEYVKQNNCTHISKYRKKYNKDYTDNVKYELINGVMKQCYQTIARICEYIDGVYFIRSDRVESSLIPLLMTTEKMLDGHLDLMISKDIYDLQYVNNKFMIIYPLKDESKILTEQNVFEVFREKEELTVDYDLPSYLLSFILSVIGNKRRGIEKMRGMGLNSIYKALSKLFKSMDIGADEYVSFEQLALAIKEDPQNPSGNREHIVSNYMCTDLDRQLAMVSSPQKTNIEKQIIDRYNEQTLMDLNERYFETCPINIIELNNYSPRKKSVF